MIDLSKYRIIDLSHELVPGERKLDGRYLHGEPFYGRPVEVQEMMAYNARMHFIQSETHNGTHVSIPSQRCSSPGQAGLHAERMTRQKRASSRRVPYRLCWRLIMNRSCAIISYISGRANDQSPS